ncbi:hypothetical protein BGX29_003147, partial [Mortierella sp. GBA35]
MRKNRIAEILRFVLPDMALEIETGCDGSEAPLGPTIGVVVASQQDLVRREAILRTSAYDTVYTKETKVVLSSGGDGSVDFALPLSLSRLSQWQHGRQDRCLFSPATSIRNRMPLASVHTTQHFHLYVRPRSVVAYTSILGPSVERFSDTQTVLTFLATSLLLDPRQLRAITEDLLASRVLDHDWQFPFGAVSWTSDWSFMVEQAFRQDPFPFLEPILQMMAAFQEHPATDVDATQLTFVEHRMKTENLFITMAFFTSAPQPYPGAGGRCWMLVLPDAPPSLVSAIAIPV